MASQKRAQVLRVVDAERITLPLELLDDPRLVGDRLQDDRVGDELVGEHGLDTLSGEVLGDCGLPAAGQREAFRHLSSNRVVLVRRDRDGRQYADDGDHDQQFDEREALLDARCQVRPTRGPLDFPAKSAGRISRLF